MMDWMFWISGAFLAAALYYTSNLIEFFANKKAAPMLLTWVVAVLWSIFAGLMGWLG